MSILIYVYWLHCLCRADDSAPPRPGQSVYTKHLLQRGMRPCFNQQQVTHTVSKLTDTTCYGHAARSQGQQAPCRAHAYMRDNGPAPGATPSASQMSEVQSPPG